MFRHSEIYALLRERQVKKENKDAGFDEGSSPSCPKDDILAEAHRILDEGMVSDNDDDDDEGYAAFLAAEHQQIQTGAARKKRKRAAHNPQDERSKEPTSRRLAREMDEAGASDTILDYGDDGPEDTASREQFGEEDLDELNGRKKVKYDDQEEGPVEAAKAPAGRKIWWPAIGS